MYGPSDNHHHHFPKAILYKNIESVTDEQREVLINRKPLPTPHCHLLFASFWNRLIKLFYLNSKYFVVLQKITSNR